MPHWVLIATSSKRVVNEFDTNVGGGAASELLAARGIAQTYASTNMQKVVLCSALRILTPSAIPPAPSVDDQPQT